MSTMRNCDDVLRDLYPEIERRMMPTIRKKAQKLRKYVDLDDAVQEGRLALLQAMSRYDFNRSHGQLARYVSECIENKFNKLFSAATAQCRMPHVAVQGEDDKWTKVRVDLVSIESEGFPEIPDDIKATTARECQDVDTFCTYVESMLDGRDVEVFNAKLSNIPRADVIPTNAQVALHLGINKNAVDFSLMRIRKEFGLAAAQPQFADLFEGADIPARWRVEEEQ